MNHIHHPRSIVILLFILVAGTFFVGSQRAFVPAQARMADLPTSTSTAGFPALDPTLTPLPASLLPPPTDEAIYNPTLPPTNTPEPDAVPAPIDNTVYADTTGIIALAILLVVVVVIGMLLGERKPQQNKEPKK